MNVFYDNDKPPPTFGGICNAAVKHRRMYHPTKSISEPSGNDKLPDVQSCIANAAQHRYMPLIWGY